MPKPKPGNPAKDWHRLSNRDARTMTAICDKCGPITMAGRGVRGNSFYCPIGKSKRRVNTPFEGTARPVDSWHRLSAIDDESRTGTCSICGPNVKLDKGSESFSCANANRQRATNFNYYYKRSLAKYNLTPERYEQMVKDQNGVCLVCKDSNKNGRRLYVDHDHKCCAGKTSCGKCIRGLLCNVCNIVLGQLNDDKERLLKLAAYLEKEAA